MRQLWLLMAVWVLPVAASDFGARYPAGSIRDAEQAQAVLKGGRRDDAYRAECKRSATPNACESSL